ncbi:Pimeloyl-ACP methyl ester carboxylesterase [Pedobacter steynii]|uniref:Pimeloyl-ACP methyl ester carboxylesterase n=1 Tax=Pedobacter steynii TaxID=430522 RepID=A0A1G9ULK1_9SPHI|nr:alpha/beta hydrolase [Pedobacter steynii]NQX40804.1 alpha/beta hydrolase [Pedobacter steynii]SDM60723.1 Pimeloyl-ACP methyl ester carboxylesterase [Pedobacter steynii]
MKTLNLKNKIKTGLLATTVAIASVAGTVNEVNAQEIKNVVLVHGAFADGSGYKALYTVLTKKGYHVTVVQNPLSSLEDDVKATQVVLDKQDGPVILAGHSWGGTVITEAGNHPKVAALVYIAAFQPDNGESTIQWLQTAPPAPENGVLAPDDKGIVYYDKAKFHKGFAADISKEEADFMYASQGAFYAKGFITPVTHAAWRDKPAYGLIATEDKSIAPEIQHAMYKRSNTKVTEVKGSHVIFMSQPEKVASVIIEAAKKGVQKK